MFTSLRRWHSTNVGLVTEQDRVDMPPVAPALLVDVSKEVASEFGPLQTILEELSVINADRDVSLRPPQQNRT